MVVELNEENRKLHQELIEKNKLILTYAEVDSIDMNVHLDNMIMKIDGFIDIYKQYDNIFTKNDIQLIISKLKDYENETFDEFNIDNRCNEDYRYNEDIKDQNTLKYKICILKSRIK